MPTTPRSFSPQMLTYTTVTFLLVVLSFAFTWFSLRPTFFVGFCHDEAGASARHMTKTKVGIAANAVQRAEYERLAMADLYLQADYEFFFRSCMRTHGFDR